MLDGYDPARRLVSVADPLADNPAMLDHKYTVPMSRLVAAIMLGVLTYDANLLIVKPKREGRGARDIPDRGGQSGSDGTCTSTGDDRFIKGLPDRGGARHRTGRVFNLCRSYRYQSAGYYVSLLAEARGQRPLPAITAIQDLKLSPLMRLVSQDLDELVRSSLQRIKSDELELSVYFGRNMAKQYDKLANALFNAFPAPMLRARFEHNGVWRLAGVRAIAVGEVPESHRPFLAEQAQRSLKRAPRKSEAGNGVPIRSGDPPRTGRGDRPVLPDALKRFIRAGESMGIRCELIEKDAYGRIAELDGLFIRVNTGVNHYTYRRRAAAEGLSSSTTPSPSSAAPTRSTRRDARGIGSRHPGRSRFRRSAAGVPAEVGLPCVVKKPDSSFSVGVLKAADEAELRAITDRLEETDLLVAQEFVPTDFDWRIGVLGGEPLYACRYFMASGHWQIVKRDDAGELKSGDWQTVPISETPKA